MIYLASDHGGFALKEQIKDWLSQWNYEFEDMGAMELNPTDDYPDFVGPAAQKVSENPTVDKAIVLGRTGIGEAVVANKMKGVRAVSYTGADMQFIKMSRTHDDTNVLSIAADFTNENRAREAVQLWLSTPFSNEERHVRRLQKITTLE